jgi:predicted GIY-YIG superfamily endonuclease
MISRVYVLLLKDNHFYVGQSQNVKRRLEEHVEGKGSAWTKLHPVIDIMRVTESTGPHDEQNLTVELMAKYGIDKGRGGRYVLPSLPPVDITAAQKDVWNYQGACLNCGDQRHYIGDCPHLPSRLEEKATHRISPPREGSKIKVTSPVLVVDDLRAGQHHSHSPMMISKQQVSSDSVTGPCTRCGRRGHTVGTCYAKTHLVSGKSLLEVASPSPRDRVGIPSGGKVKCCRRCGRPGHNRRTCDNI